jgi:hypothetical protein
MAEKETPKREGYGHRGPRLERIQEGHVAPSKRGHVAPPKAKQPPPPPPRKTPGAENIGRAPKK